jgi:uncharacterized surface protein with fasciclin (FAS1) repeats
MKKILNLLTIGTLTLLISCKNQKTTETNIDTGANLTTGQEAVQDDVSQKDVVKVAMSSPDHTTLVAALKQAELVTALSNAGPFTVFAPTNAAFDKLPAGTVDELMKKEKKNDLINILEYHVSVAVYKTEHMRDGQQIEQVNGDKITLNVKDGKVMVNGTANIVASVRASNGIVHVIDAVLLPPAKN